MKFHYLSGLVLSGILTFSSCSSTIPTEENPDLPPEEVTPPSDVNPPEEETWREVENVFMSAEDVLAENGRSTRTSLTLGENKLIFTWAENDQVGVYPTEGAQIFFSIKAGAGAKKAKFDGGAWALKTNATYAAYYPYNSANVDRSNADIQFSYEGQQQKGNASLEHLGAYDLMATNATKSANEELNFKFFHVNSIAQFRLNLPVANSFKSVMLSCNEPIFGKVCKLDLSGAEYAYAPVELTNKLEMALSDVNTTDKLKEVVLYMMLPPTDLSMKTVFVTLHSADNRIYQGVLAQKNMKSGHAYSFAATMVDVTVSSEVEAPGFGKEDQSVN